MSPSIEGAREERELQEAERQDDAYYREHPGGADQPRAYYERLRDLRAVGALMNCAPHSPIAREMLDELLADGEKP